MTKAFPGAHAYLTLWRCDRCGFPVPRDQIGAAILREHIREHDTEETS